MAGFESVVKLVNEWEPGALPTELKYRDSLLEFLRAHTDKVKIEKEYRHNGTTTDIYIKSQGFFSATEVFIELKRDLKQKTNCDRLVGQIEALEPSKNKIILVLCGETNPSLLTRLKEKYVDTFWESSFVIVLKEAKPEKSKAAKRPA